MLCKTRAQLILTACVRIKMELRVMVCSEKKDLRSNTLLASLCLYLMCTSYCHNRLKLEFSEGAKSCIASSDKDFSQFPYTEKNFLLQYFKQIFDQIASLSTLRKFLRSQRESSFEKRMRPTSLIVCSAF